MGLLTTMKGLPLAYNRDMQEDKEGFFDSVDTLMSTLEVFAGMLKTVRFKTDKTTAPRSRVTCWPPTWRIIWSRKASRSAPP